MPQDICFGGFGEDDDDSQGYTADKSGGSDFSPPRRRGGGSEEDSSDDDDDPHNLLSSGLSSGGSSEQQLQERLQDRLMSYLMENLHRAVDEIYYMCEHESMAGGCSEAVAALADRMADFEQLRERIQMQERFGEGELKSSITWEVQTSPLHAPSLEGTGAADRHGAAGHRHHFKRQGSKEGAGGAPGAQSDGGAPDAAAESGSDSEPEGGSETSPAAEAQLTIDVPSDEEAYEAGLASTSSATQPASAAPPSARSSKRSPSKALAHLEKRLLTPERRKKTAEQTLREQIEKQERAEKLRSMLLSEKQGKLRQAASRAARVSAAQEEQRLKRRLFMDERHEKAEQLHEAHVQAILTKASKETQKVKEVRFINQMMESNRSLDLKGKLADRELRRESLLSQNAAKTALEERQAAAQEKRRSMEADRKLRLQEKAERRLQTQRRRAAEKEKAQGRRDLQAKAGGAARRPEPAETSEQREFERLEHELVTRLNEVSRRKKAYLESIKGGDAGAVREEAPPAAGEHSPLSVDTSADALSLRREDSWVRAPRVHDASTSQSELDSSSSTANTSRELSAAQSPSAGGESPRKKAIPVVQRTRATKRKMRKLRQALSSMKDEMAADYGARPDGLAAAAAADGDVWLRAIVRSADGALQRGDERGVEHALQDLSRWVGGQGLRVGDPLQFCRAGAVQVLVQASTKPGARPSRLVAAEILHALVKSNPEIWLAMMVMNHVTPLVDVLVALHCNCTVEEVAEEPAHCTAYKSTCTNLVALFLRGSAEHADACARLSPALVEYVVLSRLTQLLTSGLFLVLSATGGTPNSKQGTQARHVDYFTACFRLLGVLSGFYSQRISAKPVFEPLPAALGADVDVMSAFTSTEISGILQVLGSILLDGGPSSGASSDVMGIALSALTVFNNVAGQDLPLLQLSLSSDIYAVNFLHTMNFLLTQSAETGDWVLLDEVLLFIGYFALENERNQGMLHWQKVGEGESQGKGLLQLMCTMPMDYFSDRRRVDVLFPTLIASCFPNESSRAILERELSTALLVDYLDVAETTYSPSCPPTRFELPLRFPRSLWAEARAFFVEPRGGEKASGASAAGRNTGGREQ